MLTYEGGLRVPCVMRWPGKISPASTCDELAATIDLLPTLAKLAGAALPEDRTLDGRDIWPLISGESKASPHDAFYYYCFTHLQAVRSGKWKLVLPRPEHPKWTGWSGRFHGSQVERLSLYDLEADVGEAENLAEQHPDVVAGLLKLAETGRAELGDYDRIGNGARFFDEGPRRPESRRWIDAGSANAQAMDGGGPYPQDFTYSIAIDHQPGVTRRDPSDVIKVDNVYYVWYSKVTDGPDAWMYPSGYSADVWYATSPDGRHWSEQGQAVGKGADDAWDAHGVFTPNILAADGNYYLFYTAVAKGHGMETPTRIGVAISESPDGPWKKFEGNPALVPSEDPQEFDSMRVDDAAFVVRDGAYWFYYKGRQQAHTPGETKMGVAIADSPTGPYVKQAQPLHAGHEVMVWPHGGGVASLATAAGPRHVYFAPDGLDFQPRNPVANPPGAPGAFRNDDFDGDLAAGQGLKWGISHAHKQGDLYLLRFDCKWTPPDATQAMQAAVRYDHPEPVGNLQFDFESSDPQGWEVVEGSFEALINDRSNFHHVMGAAKYNKQGKYFLCRRCQNVTRNCDENGGRAVPCSLRVLAQGMTLVH